MNKVLYNIDQTADTTETQKAQARINIGIFDQGHGNWLVPDRPQPDNDLILTTDRYGTMQWAPQAEAGGIKPSQLSSYILAGSNITITPGTSSITISSTVGTQLQSNWAETDQSSVQYILNKPDLSTYATQTDLSGKQDVLTAGQNITILNNVISATAAPQEQADWAETDTSAVDYIKNKPAIPVVPSMKPLVAGSNVSIVEGTNDVTISATAAPQLQANWNETNTYSVQYIQNKPTIPTLPTMKPLVAGSNITITEGVSDVTIAASGGAAQVQADWTEADTTNPAYIQNKPNIPAAQVQADWDATSGLAEILNKPTIPSALSAGTGINITNNAISRRVQFVSTSNTYNYVRSIIDAGDLPVLDKANGSMHDLFVCTMYRGSDIQFIGSAYGETTLYNLASNNSWTSQILEPQILSANAGRVLAINAAGTDAEWRSWVAVPSYAFADRGKLLKVVYEDSSLKLAWGQPDGYVPWETDWASGFTHSHTVTADEVTAGYFDMYQAFAAGADTASTIVDPIRVNLVWDTWCTSGLSSNYVSSIDFAIGVDGGSYRDMFTDNSPAHEVHKDWFIYPNYLLHTRCNSIRIRYHLTSNATAGTDFQNEVSGLVDQVR